MNTQEELNSLFRNQFTINSQEGSIKKLNELIENKTIVDIQYNYFIPSINDFGIILRFNEEYLYYLSSSFVICFLKIINIEYINTRNDQASFLFSLELNDYFRKKSMFEKNKFFYNLPKELITLVKSYLNFDIIQDDFLNNLNLRSYYLFSFLKMNNFILRIGCKLYDLNLISKILKVNEKNVEVLVMDENGIFLTNSLVLNFEEITFFTINFSDKNLIKFFNNYQKNNKIMNAVKKIFPQFEFRNDIVNSREEPNCSAKNIYFMVRVDDTRNKGDYFIISKKYINRLSFIADYLDSNEINTPLNIINNKNPFFHFQDFIEDYSSSLKDFLSGKEEDETFYLRKIKFKNCIKEFIQKFDECEELIEINNNMNLFYIGKDNSESNLGIYLINKNFIKDIDKIYVDDLKRERLKSNKNISEIKEIIDSYPNIFDYLKGKYCFINLKSRFLIRAVIDNFNYDDKILYVRVTDYSGIPFSKITYFKLDDIISINFSLEYLDDVERQNIIYLNNSETISRINFYHTFYQNIIENFSQIISESNFDLQLENSNWYINNFCIDQFSFYDHEASFSIIFVDTNDEIKCDFSIDKNDMFSIDNLNFR